MIKSCPSRSLPNTRATSTNLKPPAALEVAHIITLPYTGKKYQRTLLHKTFHASSGGLSNETSNGINHPIPQSVRRKVTIPAPRGPLTTNNLDRFNDQNSPPPTSRPSPPARESCLAMPKLDIRCDNILKTKALALPSDSSCRCPSQQIITFKNRFGRRPTRRAKSRLKIAALRDKNDQTNK